VIGLESAKRRMEILSVRREHVDLAARMIFIPGAKAGARKQPITRRLAEFLEGYLAALPVETPWLFPSATSGHRAHDRCTQGASARRRRSGLDLDRVVRRTLRHAAITHMVQALVNLPTVKIFSGHKTLSMVERYAHASNRWVPALAQHSELLERLLLRVVTGCFGCERPVEGPCDLHFIADTANPSGIGLPVSRFG
jgi:integrase